MSFADRITAEATARGYVGRALQILQQVATFPWCFEYAKTIAAALPAGRLGKAAHVQTVYRIFRECKELFERIRLKPGAVPAGGKHALPNGGGQTRVNLAFLGLKTPKTKTTPQRPFNVNRQSVAGPVASGNGVRLRHAIIELPERVSVDPELAALALWASDPALPKPRASSLAHSASAASSGPPSPAGADPPD